MQRRITLAVVDEHVNNRKAVQPNQDDLIIRLLTAVLAEERRENDYDKVTVIHVTVTKEDLTGVTESPEGDHPSTIISCVQYPHETAEEGVAVGNEATWRRKSGHWLVKLIRTVLKRTDELLFSCFLKELFKNCGGEIGKLLSKRSTWILFALMLWYVLDDQFRITLSQLLAAIAKLFVSMSL